MADSWFNRINPRRTQARFKLLTDFSQRPWIAHVCLNFACTSPAIATTVFRKCVFWVIEATSTHLAMLRFFSSAHDR